MVDYEAATMRSKFSCVAEKKTSISVKIKEGKHPFRLCRLCREQKGYRFH
jgi:hypothetical protein